MRIRRRAEDNNVVRLYLHHVLQRDVDGERHVGVAEHEALVHMLVYPAARALFFGRNNTVRYEAGAAGRRALAVAVACVDSPHAQPAVTGDFDIQRVIVGEDHAEGLTSQFSKRAKRSRPAFAQIKRRVSGNGTGSSLAVERLQHASAIALGSRRN